MISATAFQPPGKGYMKGLGLHGTVGGHEVWAQNSGHRRMRFVKLVGMRDWVRRRQGGMGCEEVSRAGHLGLSPLQARVT